VCRQAVDRTGTTVRIILPHLETGSTEGSEKGSGRKSWILFYKAENRTPLSRKKEKRRSGIRGYIKKRRELRRISKIP